MSKARDLSKLVNDSIFTVDSSNNVGVGSTVPTKKMDVVGIISATSFMGSGANINTLNASNITSGTLPDARLPTTLPAISGANLTNLPDSDTISEGNTKAEVVDTGSDGHFKVETEGAERLRVNSSGFVGVNTDSPGRQLTVSGGSAEGVIQITNNTSGGTAGNGFELLHFTSGETQLLNRENGAMRFDTNGTERLRISSDGTSLFNTSTVYIRETDSTAAQLMIQNSTTGTSTGDGLLLGIDSNEIAYLYNYENTALVFGTNNTEVFRATTTGQFNVGSGGFVVESDGDISTNLRGHGHIELDSTGSFSSPKVKLFSNSGNAEFAGGITAGGNLDFTDSTLDLYSQTTTSSSKTFQLFSDIGGTKTEKMFIQADGSSSFSRYIESSRFTNNSALGVDIGGTEYGLAVYDGSSNLYAGVQSNGNALFDNIGNDTTLSIGDKTNSSGRLILTAKSSTLEIHSRSNHPIEFLFNTVTKASLATDGTFSDSIGPLRRLGIHAGAGVNISLTTGHAGYLSRMTAGGTTVTVPANTLTAGDMCSVFNVSTGNVSIAPAGGVTMYNSADGATGTRTLAAKGLCTILCSGTNEFIISGAGLS